MAGCIFERNTIKMKKIISAKEAIRIIPKLKKLNKKIVLAGGCFDILHIGHIKFLEGAKKKGSLFLLLESDNSVKKLKGEGRPIYNQKERAKILSSLTFVDFVIPLTKSLKNEEYDKLIKSLKPDLIAATINDSGEEHKRRQAKSIGAKLFFASKRIKNKSTSKIIESLND